MLAMVLISIDAAEKRGELNVVYLQAILTRYAIHLFHGPHVVHHLEARTTTRTEGAAQQRALVVTLGTTGRAAAAPALDRAPPVAQQAQATTSRRVAPRRHAAHPL